MYLHGSHDTIVFSLPLSTLHPDTLSHSRATSLAAIMTKSIFGGRCILAYIYMG